MGQLKERYKPFQSPEPFVRFMQALDTASSPEALEYIVDNAPIRQEPDMVAVEIARRSASGRSAEENIKDIIKVLEIRTKATRNESRYQFTMLDIFGPEYEDEA